MPRHVIGCMTGTSIDAIDAALVRIEGTGLELRSTFIKGHSRPFGTLVDPLRRLATQTPLTAQHIADINHRFSLALADAINELRRTSNTDIDLVAVHGQTVYHAPPVSWQLVNLPLIAHRTGLMTVGDLRQADLAAGGQGAPLTPLSDWVMFRSRDESRAIVNLGGFCNATLLPRGDGPVPAFLGCDVCVCNQLLDRIARERFQCAFDRDGSIAASATPDADASANLLDRMTRLASRRSLGTGDELVDWLLDYARVPGRVLAASACDAIAQRITLAVRDADRVILAGGGTRHRALVNAIATKLERPVSTSADLGVPIDMREAAGWAVLGALAVDGTPLPIKHVTGAHANVRAGVIAPP